MLGTGIQFGKTTVGAVKAKIAIHTYTDPSDNFLIVAPNYKILQQSTLPAFLRIMEGMGTFSKADMVFKVYGGGTVYFRTGENPDSVVGITNVRFVWGDESGLFTLYFWENLQARAAFKEAQIVLTTSPYTLNWIFKEIIRPSIRGNGLSHVDLIQAASWENPYMPPAVIERARVTMDPRRFNALFGGQWERMSGLVYDCFDEEENQCDAFPLPPGTLVSAGIDWGFTNPFACTVRAITPDGNHYQVAELYRTGMTLSQKIAACQQLKSVWNIKTFYCDPEEPASIAEFNSNGLPAVAADNDIKFGVAVHYELIKTRRYKMFRGSNPHTLDEIDVYHYPAPEDLQPDQNEKDQKPVAQNNHALDSARYVSVMTRHALHRMRVHVAGEASAERESDYQRIERLKRGGRGGSRGNSENWS